MRSLLGDLVVGLQEIIPDHLHVDLCPQEDAVLSQHELELVHAYRREGRDEERLADVFVLVCGLDPLQGDRSDLLEHFSGLAREHAQEDYVTLLDDPLVVELGNHAELLLERSQEVRLPRGHAELQIVETARYFQEFGEYHRAQVTASDDAYFEGWHLVEKFDRVGDHLGGRLALFTIVLDLLLFSTAAPCRLLFLNQERLLVDDQVVENAGEENALEHDDIPHHLARQESVLQVSIGNEIVEPLLPELGHAAHLEKVR